MVSRYPASSDPSRQEEMEVLFTARAIIHPPPAPGSLLWWGSSIQPLSPLPQPPQRRCQPQHVGWGRQGWRHKVPRRSRQRGHHRPLHLASASELGPRHGVLRGDIPVPRAYRGGTGVRGGHSVPPHPGSAPCSPDSAPEVKVKGALPGDTGATAAWPGGEFGPWVKGEGRAVSRGQAPFRTVYFFVND